MGGLMQINPIWMYGPYDPGQVTAGSQPDWYMGWLEGGLRIMPNWETHHRRVHHRLERLRFLAWLLMGILFTALGGVPVHRALDHRRQRVSTTCWTGRGTSRPAPGLGVAGVTAYGLLWAAGGNDIIATHFGLSLNAITWFMRFAVFIGPVIAFIVARRWAISLQRHDRDLLLHGYETGVIIRSPEGGYSELHAPINPERAYVLASQPRHEPLRAARAPRRATGCGHRATARSGCGPGCRTSGSRDEIQKPTAAELEAAASPSLRRTVR